VTDATSIQQLGIPNNNLVGTLPRERGLLSSDINRFDLGMCLVVVGFVVVVWLVGPMNSQ